MLDDDDDGDMGAAVPGMAAMDGADVHAAADAHAMERIVHGGNDGNGADNTRATPATVIEIDVDVPRDNIIIGDFKPIGIENASDILDNNFDGTVEHEDDAGDAIHDATSADDLDNGDDNNADAAPNYDTIEDLDDLPAVPSTDHRSDSDDEGSIGVPHNDDNST